MKWGTKILIWTVIIASLVTAALLYLETSREELPIELTRTEFQWLEKHATTIRYAPLPDSPPIDYVDRGGRHHGITSDYLKQIQRKLGIRFVQVRCSTWKEILEKLRNNELDLVGSVQDTPERQEFLHFTAPYLSLPNVILTRTEWGGQFSLDTMANISIAVVEGSATYDYILKNHPEYKLIPVQDAATGFRMVSFMEADAMVADLGVASYYIEELGITNLRVAGDIDYPWNLCLASRKDWPLLNSILDKALDNITVAERRAIKQKWIKLSDTVHYPRDRSLRIIGFILLVTLLIIGSIMFWNQTLRRQVTRHSTELGRVRQSHVQVARALGESEERFRVLVETSNDMIWEMDFYGAYRYVSPRVKDILGYTPEELKGRNALSLMTKQDSARKMETIRASTVETTIDCEVNTYIHKDGHRVILESSGIAFANDAGELAGFRGVSRDITERIANENALRRSEDRFRNMVETTSDWIWEVNTEGLYQYASPQASELLGYTAAELIGNHFTELMPPTDGEETLAKFDSIVAQGKQLHSMVTTNRHKDGRTVMLETSAVPFYDKEWNILGYRGISRDITSRVLAEKQLEFERSLFRSFMEHAPDLIYFKDTEGRFIEVNTAKAQEQNLSPEDLIGRTDFDFMPEAQAKQRMIDETEVMRTRQPIQKEEMTTTPVGTRWYLTTKVPRYDENGEVIGTFGTSWNITYRKQAEDSIRNIVEGVASVGRRFFNSMVEQLAKTLDADFTYISEFADDSHEMMRTIAVSSPEGDAENFEYELNHTPCQSVLSGDRCVHFANAPERFPDTPQLKEMGIDSYIGIPLVDSEQRALGMMVALYKKPVEQVELATSVMQVFAGRTSAELERLQATKELIAARTLLENIVNSTPSTIIAIDSDNRVMQWNQEAENLSGMSAELAQGQTLDRVFPNLGKEMNTILETMNVHDVQRYQRIHCTIKDEPHIVDVTVFPITNDRSEGAVIRLDDVTDHVRIEEMMVQSEKMMSVGGLAAGMAHEINNPLAGILQNLQVMKNRVTHDTDRNISAAIESGTTLKAIQTYMENRGLLGMMDSVSEAGRRAAKIVDNMLSFSRKDEAHFSPNNLEEIIERSIELASNDYNLKKRFDFRHIQIIREFETIQPIPCEGSQIQQVILNLLSNSAQAMAEHAEKMADPVITIRLKAEPEMVLIEVQDNGPGMDSETRKRAFEPFFTTKDVGHGTGLGLSVSYFIITENHGGTMNLFSAPGRGARFSIRIPFEHRKERWGLRL